jgi:hypothetical protein
VSWWSVHEWVEAPSADVESWPTAGTPDWCELDDIDPRKVAALFDAAQHWALRLETSQQHLAEASRDVAAGADWPAIASDILHRHQSGYIAREIE